MEHKNSFEYKYSAPEQEEIRKIREKYAPKDTSMSALEQLKKLDEDAERPGRAVSLTLGIVGTLLFGAGMSCTMVLTDYFVPGIILGVIGMAVLAMAYPAYKKITAKEREKVAAEILRLTDELMK